MRSLRGRLSLGVGLVILIVLGVSGLLISHDADQIARDGIDRQLRSTAQLSRQAAAQTIARGFPRSPKQLNAVLQGTDTSLRVQVGDAPLRIGGAHLLTGPFQPLGLRTIHRDGQDIRVLVVQIQSAGLGDNLAKLEVATSLRGVERRNDALGRRLLRLGIGALVLAALGTFLASIAVLGPLRRLRSATGRVAGAEDLDSRVSETDGPAEVRELAASFNGMLSRLETSSESRERALAATRRFALDAGHELRTPLTTVQATLSALYRHPDVAAEDRTAMLGDALDEQRRLVNLLDGLQAYARGDASTVEHVQVDLCDVVLAACNAFPEVVTDVPDEPVIVSGWEPGLRLIADNLVSNAVRHGAGGAQVTLTTARVLTVDDNGSGVPADQRGRIFEPFARLESEREGSGLGLALVAQQVREHGAEIEVGDAPGGGARFTVRF